jgi:hypothetical protein
MTFHRSHADTHGGIRAALVLGFALVLAAGCGPVSIGDDEPVQAPRETEDVPPRPDAEATSEDPLAGTWWVLAADLPLRALRMNLLPANGPDSARSGHWVSFDWRATTSEDQLVRRSRPVAITMRTEGDLLVIEGPSPMLTDRGEPNGRRGDWRLELRRTNMPGEPLRLSGSAVHTELTEPTGVPVDLERTLRPWSRN